MDASTEDLKTLLQLQQIDLQIIKAKKERNELPQLARLKALHQKAAAIQDKRQKIADLNANILVEIEKVESEDSLLEDKQHHAQALIDAAGTDYRDVEAHSKELNGFAKRRNDLGEKHDKLSEESQRTASMLAQADAALEKLDAETQSTQKDYDERDGQLAGQIDELEGQRAELCQSVDGDLLDKYDRTAARSGGVAIGRLIGNTCGVCRTAIDGGRLIELKNEAPLGVCPVCKRLLIIGADE